MMQREDVRYGASGAHRRPARRAFSLTALLGLLGIVATSACAPAVDEGDGEREDAAYASERTLWPRGSDGVTRVPVCWLGIEPAPLTKGTQNPQDETLSVFESASETALRAHVAYVWQSHVHNTWQVASETLGSPSLVFEWHGRCDANKGHFARPMIRIKTIGSGEAPRSAVGVQPPGSTPTMWLDLDLVKSSGSFRREAAVRARLFNAGLAARSETERQIAGLQPFSKAEDRWLCAEKVSAEVQASLLAKLCDITQADSCVEDAKSRMMVAAFDPVRFAAVSAQPWQRLCDESVPSLSTRLLALAIAKSEPMTPEAEIATKLFRDDLRYRLNVDGWGAFEVVHEFGHAIGLQHEHQRVDRADSCKPTSNDHCSVDPNLGVRFGPYDAKSSMNYCIAEKRGKLSTWDRAFVRYYYGRTTPCPLGREMMFHEGLSCQCPDEATGEPRMAAELNERGSYTCPAYPTWKRKGS